MTRILVAYFSQTGNTKKVAEAIFDALEGEKTIKPIDQVEDVKDYHLLFIGFPVHSHGVPARVETFLKKIPRGKKIAIFSTHGSHTGSHLSRQALEHAAVSASQAKILATFSCRGKVSMRAMEILSRSPEHRLWAEMAASAHTHPDEADLEEARSFARMVMAFSSRETLEGED